MAIATVVTRGYGNGTFSGTIPFVVTRGYTIGEAVVIPEALPFVFNVLPRRDTIDATKRSPDTVKIGRRTDIIRGTRR